MERRVVLACALPAGEMMTSARVVRAKLLTARGDRRGDATDS